MSLEKQYRFFLLSHCPRQSVGISLAEYGVQRAKQLKNHTKQPVVKETQGLGGKNLGTQRNRPPFGVNTLKSRGSFKHLNLSRLHFLNHVTWTPVVVMMHPLHRCSQSAQHNLHAARPRAGKGTHCSVYYDLGEEKENYYRNQQWPFLCLVRSC